MPFARYRLPLLPNNKEHSPLFQVRSQCFRKVYSDEAACK
jgi:hypothetical protein